MSNIIKLITLVAIVLLSYCCLTQKIDTNLSSEKNISKPTKNKVVQKPSNITPIKKKIEKKSLVQKIQLGDEVLSIHLPKVPQAIELVSHNNLKGTQRRNIKFSKRVPPNYTPHSFDKKLKESKKKKKIQNNNVGEVNSGMLAAYLRGDYMDIKSVQEKLSNADFKILASTKLKSDNSLTSILFTNDTLSKLAAKDNRAFALPLRVLIDEKNKNISITNPLYTTKGFLQEDYDEKAALSLLNTLKDNFPNLKDSKDVLKFQLLSKYHFMMGMPYYDDMIEVASGNNLLEKLKNNPKVIYHHKLDNGSTIVAIHLDEKTSKFVEIIGRKNASVLPYTIVINKNEAKILDPKYYIAIMYPKLSMSEFMAISDIPDAIVRDCERVFN